MLIESAAACVSELAIWRASSKSSNDSECADDDDDDDDADDDDEAFAASLPPSLPLHHQKRRHRGRCPQRWAVPREFQTRNRDSRTNASFECCLCSRFRNSVALAAANRFRFHRTAAAMAVAMPSSMPSTPCIGFWLRTSRCYSRPRFRPRKAEGSHVAISIASRGHGIIVVVGRCCSFASRRRSGPCSRGTRREAPAQPRPSRSQTMRHCQPTWTTIFILVLPLLRGVLRRRCRPRCLGDAAWELR